MFLTINLQESIISFHNCPTSLSTTLWWFRVAVLYVNLLSSGIVYLVARFQFTTKQALFASVSFLSLLPVFNGTFALAEPFMILFLLLSYLNFQYQYSSLRLLIGGLFLGLAILFKQTALLALLVYIGIFLSQRQYKVRNLIFMFAGMAIVVIPIVLFLWFSDALNQAFHSVVLFNLHDYRPFSIFVTLRTLPMLLFPVFPLIVSFCLMLAKNSSIFRKNLYPFGMLGVFISFTLTRPFHHYWLPVLPFFVLMLFSGLENHKLMQKIVIANLLLIGIIHLYSSWTISIPKRMRQIAAATRVDNCEIHRSVEERYLAGCISLSQNSDEIGDDGQ